MEQHQVTWPKLTALMLLSIFMGFEYDFILVLRPFDILLGVTALLIFIGAPGLRVSYIPISLPMQLFCLLLIYFAINSFIQSSVFIGVKEAIQATEMLLLFYVMGSACFYRYDQRTYDQIMFHGIACLAVVTFIYHVSQGYYVGYKQLDELKLTFGLFFVYSFVQVCVRGHWTSTVLFICAFTLLVLSGERKGWAAALVAITVMLWLNVGRGHARRLGLFLAQIGLVVIIVVPMVAPGGYVSKQLESAAGFVLNVATQEQDVNNLGTLSNRIRFVETRESLDAFRQHPWFGVGGDRSGQIIQESGTRVLGQREEVSTGVHNEFLRYALEGGAVALVLYCAAWVTLIWQALCYSVHLRRIAPDLPWQEHLSGWFGIGLVFYGFTINLFFSGGLESAMFFVWPAVMIATRYIPRTIARQRKLLDTRGSDGAVRG